MLVKKPILGPKPPKLIWMNTVEMKETLFLWYPYIPVGVATLIYGPGGNGKSHIAVDITARVTTGRGMPGHDGETRPPEKVLIMSAEDELERVLGPRLVRAGADLSKVAAPDKVFTLDHKGLEYVDNFITEASVGIVFIDPIVSYIGGKVDINKANETREFTGGLNAIAQAHGVPIVIIGHSRKSTEGSDADRAMGSVDFVNASRSALFVTTAPNGDHIMKHSKHNYSAEGKTLRFDFEDGNFQWTGEYEETGVLVPTGGKKVNSVHQWLRERLKAGPVRAPEVEAEAAEKGFSHRTLIRGKEGVAESYLVSTEGKLQWYWRLIQGAEDVEQAEVPVMGSKWGSENTRVEREIIAREAERAASTDDKVVGRGSVSKRRDRSGDVQPVSELKRPLKDDDLAQWMKDNL